MDLVKCIPNSITILRIGLSIAFAACVTEQFVDGKNNLTNLIAVFAMICLTDFIDGRIARKIGCASVIGAKLDVSADLFFIVASNIALINIGILPPWFLGFIFFKFIEFIATSRFIIRHTYLLNKNVFIFDKAGRIVTVMFFVVPGAACIFHVLIPGISMSLIHFILYSTLACGILSTYLRVKNCLKLIYLINKEQDNTISIP